jgi:hypothetical protein
MDNYGMKTEQKERFFLQGGGAAANTGGSSSKSLPVAGLYTLGRMLAYTKSDTSEKTMEVRAWQQLMDAGRYI